GEPDNVTSWLLHEYLSPHILPAGAVDSDEDQPRRVVLDQIRYRYARGDYEGARDLGEMVIAQWTRKWGPEELLTLIACRHLANALRVLGYAERAYELTKATLETMRRVIGPDSEHTLTTVDTFAANLRGRGLFQQAKEVDEENFARHL